MLVGPACYNPAPARQISVTGILNPFQNDKVIARQAIRNNPQDAITILGNTDDSTGDKLYTMDPLAEQTYLLLDVRPVGTVLFPEDDPILQTNKINGGFRYTFASARLTWIEAGGQLQCIDFDIGAGVVFSAPPTNVVDLDLLVPNPEGINQIPVPEGFPRNQRFATTVSCKATCVYSPSIGLPTIQRCVYIEGDTPFGDIGQQIPVPRGASSVQIFSTPAVGNTAPIDEPRNTQACFTVEPVPLAPGAAPPPPFDTFPTQEIPFFEDGQTLQTGRVRIPLQSNVLRIKALFGNSTVRRNVCVIFELDV